MEYLKGLLRQKYFFVKFPLSFWVIFLLIPIGHTNLAVVLMGTVVAVGIGMLLYLCRERLWLEDLREKHAIAKKTYEDFVARHRQNLGIVTKSEGMGEPDSWKRNLVPNDALDKLCIDEAEEARMAGFRRDLGIFDADEKTEDPAHENTGQ